MAVRPVYKDGQYNIECSICGCDMKSGEMILGKETMLPMHSYHAEENDTRYPVIPLIQKVPDPTNEPTDKFSTYTVAHTPTAISYN